MVMPLTRSAESSNRVFIGPRDGTEFSDVTRPSPPDTPALPQNATLEGIRWPKFSMQQQAYIMHPQQSTLML